MPSNHYAKLGGKFNMLYPYGSFVISLMSHIDLEEKVE